MLSGRKRMRSPRNWRLKLPRKFLRRSKMSVFLVVKTVVPVILKAEAAMVSNTVIWILP